MIPAGGGSLYARFRWEGGRHARCHRYLQRRHVRVGHVLSMMPVLFLAFDAVIKLFRMPMALEATRQLRFTADAVLAIGVIELMCLVLYLVPRMAVLGVVLWTGYFGGAIATHLRAGSPLLTHTFFPIYAAALLWGGLWFRDHRVRRVVREAFDVA
jgi:DoxX-like protein